MPPVFSHRIEVRFRDCDSFRHVNNAVYLTYFEQARIVMGETLGWRRVLDEAGVSLILAHASCDYKAQLVFGDEVEIRASVVGIGRRSFTSQFDAHRVRDDVLAARGPVGPGGVRLRSRQDGVHPRRAAREARGDADDRAGRRVTQLHTKGVAMSNRKESRSRSLRQVPLAGSSFGEARFASDEALPESPLAASGIDRRTMIGRTLGAAAAGSLLGAIAAPGTTEAAPAQPAGTSSPGILLPDGMRRIVTGHDDEGKSYVVRDERVSGWNFPNVFRTTGDDPFGAGPEPVPRELYPTDSPQLEPDVGGANFHFVTLPPTPPDAPLGWHRTETVDMNVLLGGELVLVLDKEEVTVHPGDVVIQRNTMHAWRNPTSEPVYWVAVLVPIRQRA